MADNTCVNCREEDCREHWTGKFGQKCKKTGCASCGDRFACTGCDMIYKKEKHCHNHVVECNGLRCSACGTEFSVLKNLQRHQRMARTRDGSTACKQQRVQQHHHIPTSRDSADMVEAAATNSILRAEVHETSEPGAEQAYHTHNFAEPTESSTGTQQSSKRPKLAHSCDRLSTTHSNDDVHETHHQTICPEYVAQKADLVLQRRGLQTVVDNMPKLDQVGQDDRSYEKNSTIFHEPSHIRAFETSHTLVESPWAFKPLPATSFVNAYAPPALPSIDEEAVEADYDTPSVFEVGSGWTYGMKQRSTVSRTEPQSAMKSGHCSQADIGLQVLPAISTSIGLENSECVLSSINESAIFTDMSRSLQNICDPDHARPRPCTGVLPAQAGMCHGNYTALYKASPNVSAGPASEETSTAPSVSVLDLAELPAAVSALSIRDKVNAGATLPRGYPRRMQPCPICKQQLGDSEASIRKHVLEHVPMFAPEHQSYACPECHERFMYEADLKSHQQSMKAAGSHQPSCYVDSDAKSAQLRAWEHAQLSAFRRIVDDATATMLPAQQEAADRWSLPGVLSGVRRSFTSLVSRGSTAFYSAPDYSSHHPVPNHRSRPSLFARGALRKRAFVGLSKTRREEQAAREDAFVAAARCGELNVINALVDVSTRDNTHSIATSRAGTYALSTAISSGRAEAVELLLRYGAVAGQICDTGHSICNSIVALAALHEDGRSLLHMLADHDIDINFTCSRHGSALRYHCRQASAYAVELLLEMGARGASSLLSCRTRNGVCDSLIVDAATGSDPKAILGMLRRHLDLDWYCPSHGTAIHHICSRKDLNSLRNHTALTGLLENGANPNTQHSTKVGPNVPMQTALGLAVYYDCTDVVSTLLQHGADPKSADDPLRIAFSNQSTPMIDVILPYHPDMLKQLQERIKVGGDGHWKIWLDIRIADCDRCRSVDSVKALLQTGLQPTSLQVANVIHPEVMNGDHSTHPCPLYSSEGRLRLLKALLEVDRSDNDILRISNAVSKAIIDFNTEAIDLLLAAKNRFDPDGSILYKAMIGVLHYQANYERQSIALGLLGFLKNVLARSTDGQTSMAELINAAVKIIPTYDEDYWTKILRIVETRLQAA